MAKQEEFDEELELGKVHTTMVNMTLYDDEEPTYIIDIRKKDNKIVLTYADGHEENMGLYSLHNMNFYRYRVQKQFYECYDKYMDEIALESFKVCVKKFGGVILSLVGLFFMYNFDIHIIIKILLTLGVVAIDVFYYFLKHYDLLVIGQELNRVEALETYFQNSREFMIHNEDEKEDDFVLGVEDVWQNDLRKEDVLSILEDVKKSDGTVLKYDVSRHKK